MIVQAAPEDDGPSIGPPLKFSETAVRASLRPAPVLGADTRSILQSIGFGSEEIDALAAEGVILTDAQS
jgi:crotonobetainyl-CoA:carnitine CoA-transferase CaiB-like acyl-CoA transferase